MMASKLIGLALLQGLVLTALPCYANKKRPVTITETYDRIFIRFHEDYFKLVNIAEQMRGVYFIEAYLHRRVKVSKHEVWSFLKEPCYYELFDHESNNRTSMPLYSFMIRFKGDFQVERERRGRSDTTITFRKLNANSHRWDCDRPQSEEEQMASIPKYERPKKRNSDQPRHIERSKSKRKRKTSSIYDFQTDNLTFSFKYFDDDDFFDEMIDEATEPRDLIKKRGKRDQKLRLPTKHDLRQLVEAMKERQCLWSLLDKWLYIDAPAEAGPRYPAVKITESGDLIEQMIEPGTMAFLVSIKE